jgi:TetR/AcrR family transcriptional regulator, regulator of biofilm formation and stress response
MLDAALRIIARDGLRAVSHRSVAAEADVPLAATTYYFSDLEDLITEAFLHWSQSQRRLVGDFHDAALRLVAQASPLSRDDLAGALADAAAGYVMDQARNHRSDRVLEYAFLHEAARMPRLRAVVHERQVEDRRFLEQFHAALGSSTPGLDAQISYSLLLGLEKGALLADAGSYDRESVREVLAHYLRSALPPAGPAGRKR